MSGADVSARPPRSNILAYAERTSNAPIQGPANADIPLLTFTFTPDERPYGVKLWIPSIVKDATPGTVSAFVQVSGGSAYGSCSKTFVASMTDQLLIDVPPGAPQLSAVVVPGVAITWKCSLTLSAGQITVNSGSGSGSARPWIMAYSDR